MACTKQSLTQRGKRFLIAKTVDFKEQLSQVATNVKKSQDFWIPEGAKSLVRWETCRQTKVYGPLKFGSSSKSKATKAIESCKKATIFLPAHSGHFCFRSGKKLTLDEIL